MKLNYILICCLTIIWQAFTREVNAHNSVNHPNVLQLIESEILRQKGDKEGRMLFPYYKVL